MAASYSYTTLREIIANADSNKAYAVKERLEGLHQSELNRYLMREKIRIQTASESGKSVQRQTRHSLWLINEEYTRRGIPPVMRSLPQVNDDDPAQVADCFAIDLQWLAAVHPKETLFFSKWKGLFRPGSFHSTCDYVSANYPRRDMWWFCKGLSLTDDQQRELHFIKKASIRKEFETLVEERDSVRIKLSIAYHSRDGRYKTDDHNATINRRLAIWFTGSLACWKPQRTAQLYEAHTGEKITRQLADSIIKQVRRDLSPTKSGQA